MSFSEEYLRQIIEKYKTGQANEHAYRPALDKFFEEITNLHVVNDPKRSEYGAPDFVFMKNQIAIAYAEAKDIGIKLDEIEKGEQVERYFGYSSLILTDYLEFRFFKNGERYGESIKIAEVKNNEIVSIESGFGLLEDTIKQFISNAKEPIKSGALLAKVMAGKARRIRDNVKAYLQEKDEEKNKSLLAVFNVIKELLLPDLDNEKFADMYAQTIVYGLFVARYYDESPDNFSRGEARDLIPASNPFLQQFFDHIAGASFDKRIEFIVNELCEEFSHADVNAIIHNYYRIKRDNSQDPIIHFYEDFLKEYDAGARKAFGVFYTPLPVVNFIVRAIDDILKKEFNLKGIADSSKIEITKIVQNKKVKELFHKVQILDPATGTGTFLNEVISHIRQQFNGQEGRWSNYVVDDLLPRLHGFELMMASYTIAHLKLATNLKESGVDIDGKRLSVYLTNSLEKEEKPISTLFNWQIGLEKALTEESKQANKIKNELPIMVILGNPPYSGVSSNETECANSLVNKYKVEPGGNEKLKERKHWLNDDYVKFIAFAEDMIEKNGEGILGFITNNGYLDNTTFRGMRWHLLKTFDQIYIIDLHGNSKKKETTPDGSKDENVFNIQQGVSIALFVKKSGNKENLGKVWYTELFGKRQGKFQALYDSDLENIKWKKVNYKEPYYFFVPKDFRSEEEYNQGFGITDLFIKNTTGIVTARDGFVIAKNKDILLNRIRTFCDDKLTDLEIRQKFFLNKKAGKYKSGDSRGWKMSEARKIICKLNHENQIRTIYYRPFDIRFIYYNPNMVDWGREKIMDNFINKNNLGLIAKRGLDEINSAPIFISDKINESRAWSRPGMQGIESIFPLYIYSEDSKKIVNFDKEIYNKIIANIKTKVIPENVLDYIYAVLHSPTYRKKYKEFLKIDFPRVAYPKDEKQFFALAKLGEELRHLHLLESPKVSDFITTYSEGGDDLVEKVEYKNKNVYINEKQYFGGTPEDVWNFYIGGYQPAQKWLKDRKGRNLANADIEHYQKMIVALNETIRIMEEIDKIYE
ncbi:N-6 DNA methylase [Candidatus Parcubacteria bacterium]|nr:N-6 DNA methylase [Patescibacteria group bacterium]MCG2694145.1 N-6 DNA methylase [Candidatus Parcubacteria bacterium]